MVDTFNYHDHKLRRLFAELDVKQRKKALKGAFRREATRVRKTAIQNLRTSGIRTDHDLERGIRSVVFRDSPGFRVTVGSKKANKKGKGERGMHLTRAGLKKPILIWAEGGTSDRWTMPKKGTRRRADRKRERHATGHMRKYGFMEKTLRDVRGSVASDLRSEVKDNIIRTAKRYGCK